MNNELTLEINDFGPINKAKIDLGKINIVAGDNSSGKSTASKLLYSLLGSISQEGDSICYREIVDLLRSLQNKLSVQDDIKKLKEFNENNRDMLVYGVNDKKALADFADELKKLLKFVKKSDIHSINFESAITKTIKAIDTYNSNEKRVIKALKLFLYDEFDNEKEIFEKWNDGYINLYDNENDFNLCVNLPLDGTEGISSRGRFPINDIFYLETPFILELTRKVPYKAFISNEGIKKRLVHHHNSLINRLDSEIEEETLDLEQITLELEGLSENPRKNILNFINDTIEGEIYFDQEKHNAFVYSEGNNKFTMRSTATGIKTLAILKSLIEKNLDSNSIIIMDEPEVHLHPKWQLILAELIFKLVKDLNISFYINTHSPQFLEAIETYSMVNDCIGDVNYYLTRPFNENEKKFNIEPIKKEELNKIHDSLGAPYLELAKIKGKLLAEKSKKGRDSYKLSNQ